MVSPRVSPAGRPHLRHEEEALGGPGGGEEEAAQGTATAGLNIGGGAQEQLQQVRIWQEELCAEWRYAKMKVKSCVVRAMYPRRLMVNYLLSLL